MTKSTATAARKEIQSFTASLRHLLAFADEIEAVGDIERLTIKAQVELDAVKAEVDKANSELAAARSTCDATKAERAKIAAETKAAEAAIKDAFLRANATNAQTVADGREAAEKIIADAKATAETEAARITAAEKQAAAKKTEDAAAKMKAADDYAKALAAEVAPLEVQVSDLRGQVAAETKNLSAVKDELAKLRQRLGG